MSTFRRSQQLLKKARILIQTRKYFSPSNLTLYKAQIRPSLEYTRLPPAAPTILSILDAVQRRAIRLIGDPALT
nr:unnamed protein product [Callosobruchus chinensis]